MLIDIHTFTLLKKTINRDGWLELPASGNSMFPYIQKGNLCRFVACKPFLFKKGDVILYYSQTGQLIAHRFVRSTTEKNQSLFLLKGDTNLGYDQLIEENRIIGKLVTIQKQHIKFAPDHFISVLWGKLILTFPILSGILRKHLNKKFQY